MPTASGEIVGTDDFLHPCHRGDIRNHEFHVVVRLDLTGRLVRLRGGAGVSALVLTELVEPGTNLDDFGALWKEIDALRAMFALGERILFNYLELEDADRRAPGAHAIDVRVLWPHSILPNKMAIAFPARSAVCLSANNVAVP